MAAKQIELSSLTEEELLGLRLCELPVRISGTWLEACVEDLHRELQTKGISFKPACYLADEWLVPDGEPVIGIPFYLADPCLTRLEKKMMLEAEGSSREWCMKLLRHESGHTLNYAFKFYRRKKWQKLFGRFAQEYPDTYRFRPYSKNYVRHLEKYYAQYHPDEDFAETFAVWLTPDLDWHAQYRGWGALVKLNYVAQLMEEIRGKQPLVASGKRYWQVSASKATLRGFYKKKMHSYAEQFPDFHDANLKEIFSAAQGSSPDGSRTGSALAAAGVLRNYKKDMLNDVAKWTGEKKYIIAELIDSLIERCRSLELAVENEQQAILKITAYVTTLVMNYLYTGGFRRHR